MITILPQITRSSVCRSLTHVIVLLVRACYGVTVRQRPACVTAWQLAAGSSQSQEWSLDTVLALVLLPRLSISPAHTVSLSLSTTASSPPTSPIFPSPPLTSDRKSSRQHVDPSPAGTHHPFPQRQQHASTQGSSNKSRGASLNRHVVCGDRHINIAGHQRTKQQRCRCSPVGIARDRPPTMRSRQQGTPRRDQKLAG